MKYIKVNWKHDSPEYPVILYSEIGDDRYEVRKVDIFPNGSYGYADGKNDTENTFLGVKPTPPFEVVNSNPEFELVEISKEEFEEIWSKSHDSKMGKKGQAISPKKRFWGLFG